MAIDDMTICPHMRPLRNLAKAGTDLMVSVETAAVGVIEMVPIHRGMGAVVNNEKDIGGAGTTTAAMVTVVIMNDANDANDATRSEELATNRVTMEEMRDKVAEIVHVLLVANPQIVFLLEVVQSRNLPIKKKIKQSRTSSHQGS